MHLPEFIETFGDAINARLADLYPPLYDAETRATCGIDLGRLGRRPLGAQADAIRAAALSIRRNPGTNIVGEMGVGKSTVAAAAAFLAGRRRVLILCPPHLVRKWAREVRQTVPGAQPTIVARIADLERLRGTGGPTAMLAGRPGHAPIVPPQFVILSRERAKLGYPWRPACVTRAARERDECGHRSTFPCCGSCFTPILDREGIAVDPAALATRKHRCAACGQPLWQADGASRRVPPHGQHLRAGAAHAAAGGRPAAGHRFPLAEYICDRMSGFFDLLLVDELHEFKASGSAQGIAMGQLAESIGTVLTCTGTLMGGYASTLFALLWRVNRRFREEFRYGDEDKFVARYGVIERQFRKGGGDDRVADGRLSKRRLYLARVKEKPGISPAVLFQLIDHAIFLRLRDVANDLPPYREHIVVVPLDREGDDAAVDSARAGSGARISQHDAYHRLATTLRAEVLRTLARGGKSRLLGAYLQALLSYPDGCTRGEVVLDKATGRVVAEAPALPSDRLYPKERALLELALRERDRGRRVLVYAVHTETRDITPRMQAVLVGAGLRVAVLKAHTVKPEAREEWVARQVAAGLDVLIAPPRCVQTGLDLIDFPTIFWVEIEYSVYTLRQASRRSWRIGQAHPVEVYFAVYEGTMQAEALALVGKKLRTALLVEGDLPQEGLATQELDDGDLLLTLAKRLAAGERADSQALESLFAGSRALEARAGEALDDSRWAEEANPAALSGLPGTLLPAAAALCEPGRQLTLLPPPQGGDTPAAAILPAMRPPPSGITMTAGQGPLVTDSADTTRPDPAPSPQANKHHGFAPTDAGMPHRDGPHGLAAPSAPSRRRKRPAKDQLKLFG